MATVSKTLDAACIELADGAADRIDRWRTELLLLAAGALPNAPEASFLGRELRGAAVVATMAEIENLLREMLVLVAREVNASGTPVRDLVQPLRVLAAHSQFESISSTTKMDERWNKRYQVTRLHQEAAISSLPGKASKGPQPPLDGKTIKPSHVQQVWRVLGLSGSPFPSVRASTALTKLASIRNDVAHRNVSISEVFLEPGKTAAHLAGYLDEMILFSLHVGVEMETYALAQDWHI